MKLDELEQSMLRAARLGLRPSDEDRRRHESELLSKISVTQSSPRLRDVSRSARSPAGVGAAMGLGGSGVQVSAGAGATWGRVALVSAGVAAGVVLGGVFGFALGRSSAQMPPASAALVGSAGTDGRHEPQPAPPTLEAPAEVPAQVVQEPDKLEEMAVSPRSAEPPQRSEPARGRRSAAVRSQPESSLAVELSMLQRARRALNAENGRLALGIVQELDERFPRGVLLEERTATRILSLCLLGRDDEARSFGAEFLARHPSSVYAERVRASCATDPR